MPFHEYMLKPFSLLKSNAEDISLPSESVDEYRHNHEPVTWPGLSADDLFEIYGDISPEYEPVISNTESDLSEDRYPFEENHLKQFILAAYSRKLPGFRNQLYPKVFNANRRKDCWFRKAQCSAPNFGVLTSYNIR
ncbi:hypothetical protein AAEY27_08855 [Kosakonia sp. BYX6]|uniref:Uncharacterized protein n=1 Tax=Kosakonia calanthes TaxID=3139408 RepID=A0ABZ3B9V0_9ENTR